MSQQASRQTWMEVLESLQRGVDIMKHMSTKEDEIGAIIADSMDDINAISTTIASGIANEKDIDNLIDIIQGSCIALFQLGWEARERTGDLSLWEEKLSDENQT